MSEREKLIEAIEGAAIIDNSQAGVCLRVLAGRIPGLADVIDGKAVIVPREATEGLAFGAGVYAAADVLCASEYVNGPEPSVILALAHRAFADGLAAMTAASPYRRTE